MKSIKREKLTKRNFEEMLYKLNGGETMGQTFICITTITATLGRGKKAAIVVTSPKIYQKGKHHEHKNSHR